MPRLALGDQHAELARQLGNGGRDGRLRDDEPFGDDGDRAIAHDGEELRNCVEL
jgi:hypothetical protein